MILIQVILTSHIHKNLHIYLKNQQTITHPAISKERSTRAKHTVRLEHFSKATFSPSSKTSLICSLFHVYEKGKQETLCTAADLPLFGRHNGIIGALGWKLVEKQRGFTDRFSLTYVSLSASYCRHNTS